MWLGGATYTVFDVETTGLFPYAGDRICEIGAVRIRPDGTEKIFESLIDPQRSIAPGAFAVNGITADMLRGKPVIGEVLPDFLEFMEDSVLVAYNSGFDLGFIENALGHKSHMLADFQAIDALKLARKLFPDIGRYNLAHVAGSLGISTEGKHRALADAVMTARIFIKELDILRKRGIHSVGEIVEPRKQRSASVKTDDGPVLGIIEDAIRKKGVLNITYRSMWNSKISSRAISPREIRKGYATLYVIAYCYLRREERNFRLDCIIDASAARS